MEDSSRKLSTWVVVTTLLVIGLVASVLIGVNGLVRFKQAQRTIEVVGSAKKQVRSDLALWSGTFSAQAADLTEAYGTMTRSAARVKNYLAARGFPEKDAVFSAITTSTQYAMTKDGRQTSKIEGYKLSQTVEIRSADVDKVSELSRRATELINDGVEFQSNAPRFYYTKIADLKIEVLSMAARDAKTRADRIAENTGARAGSLTSASQGVFQITALYSTEVSDLGVYDTSSIEKEIMAVVICNFAIER